MKKQNGFYWHIHHDKLIEWCYNYRERVYFIKKYKPKNEIKTRLRLCQPVKGKLPIEFVKTWEAHIKTWEAYGKACNAHDKARKAYYGKAKEAYDKTRIACNKAWDARNRAQETYNKVRKIYKEEIEALHAKECPNCIWNGEELKF